VTAELRCDGCKALSSESSDMISWVTISPVLGAGALHACSEECTAKVVAALVENLRRQRAANTLVPSNGSPLRPVN
jgi:hypothetical protein